MQVRRITPDQFALLRQVRLAALQDAPYAFGSTYAGNINRPDEEWQQMCIARAAGNEDAGFFAYDANGEAVGMVAAHRDKESREVMHLISMWVAPEARGTGAADALIEAVCTWAKAIPVERVTLAVAPGNNRALRFYQRLGFHELPHDATTPAYVDPDDITLERVL